MLSTLFNSFFLVAATEIGDKTQLLAFVLATRFKKPWTIILGIFIATVANHYVASYVGNFLSGKVSADLLKYILVATFWGFAIWILFPDKEEELKESKNYGALLTTIVLFFLAEMGDKTQLSTLALSARYQDVLLVTIGSTLGMLAANIPAVFLGEKIIRIVPLRTIHRIASFIYFIFGLVILLR